MNADRQSSSLTLLIRTGLNHDQILLGSQETAGSGVEGKSPPGGIVRFCSD